MTFSLRLTHDEPRLAALALAYHLARPGSELDPDTKMPAARGLSDVQAALGAQLDQTEAAEAIIDVDDAQYRKLLSAIYGSVNELRVVHMRGGASGAVPGFVETARGLFPRLAQDPDEALVLAEAMMMFHRRMERAVARAAAPGEPAPENRRARWPFRRTGSGAGGGG
jgi:hypothetical protein